MNSPSCHQCKSKFWRFARQNAEKFVQKRPDEEKETLGFSKWNFSQQILIVLADFNGLSVDYRAERGGEENFVFSTKLLFYEFPEEEGKYFLLY